MKRLLLLLMLFTAAVSVQAQTTYYWVGNPGDSINVNSNWNTVLNGSGSSRSSSTGASDVLVFDGSTTASVTPFFPVVSTSSITCAQLKFTNGAIIQMSRTLSGTTTITLSGAAGEDFSIDAGSSLTLANGAGSQIIAFGAANTGRVSGNFSMITSLQAGIRNTTSGTPGQLVFTSGANFYSNITSTSTSYAFGNSTQSSERWVVFQAGANLYYDGGSSPMGSAAAGLTYQPVEFQSGSNFYIRASNAGLPGVFSNRKAFANLVVQNGASFTSDGSINRIDTLNITAGSTFVTHTSGQTTVLGNIIVNGALSTPAGSTNELMLGGTVQQSVAGIGTINLASLVVTDGADVKLERSVSVATAATVNGRIDFSTYQLTGAGSFIARNGVSATTGAGTTVTGAYLITGVSGAAGLNRGISISGAGLQAGTRVISYTPAFDTVYISRPATANATGVITFSSSSATLVTSNTGGFDMINGSVSLTGAQSFNPLVNYTLNAATTTPFSVPASNPGVFFEGGNIVFNAAVTTNASLYVHGSLLASAKASIRPQDSIVLLSGAILTGTYGSNNYFATDRNAAGQVGTFARVDVTNSSLFPIGSPAAYLPAMLTPTTASSFYTNVFQGITTDGTPNGSVFTSAQKQTVVDAVWTINRTAGSGNANLKLQWVPVLEGTTLTTFANDQIGIIRNTGTSWTLPFGFGDNAANTADTLFNTFGKFSVGARPPANPFVFNALPPKTYGDPDFSPGVISANAASAINYTSSNPAVATITGSNNIHIVGVGTTTITAQQASDGFYPAANVSQTLTVSKALLTIKADRKTKPQGDPNPTLTATYTGFVLGEGPSVFLTPLSITTTATTASGPGSYPITVSGATATNYSIAFENDTLFVRPRSAQTITFAALNARTYGAADFNLGATSTNTGIPIIYTSSNPAVATIVGANTVRIISAGTTTITALQAGSDLFFPAMPIAQTLVINRAPLTIRVADTTKVYGEPNPIFRIVYTGFVLGEGPAVFLTPLNINTMATTNSAPGYYALTPAGITAANYAITYVDGRLTILPASGTGRFNLQAFASNSSTLTVRIYSPEPDLGDVFFYDMNGKLMARRNVFLAQGFINTSFTIANLPAGLYVVQVQSPKAILKLTISLFR